MPLSDTDRVMRRIEEGRAARADELAQRAASAAASPRDLRVAPLMGARVFDPITGEEGMVIHAANQNVVVSTPGR
jgi:hypothetical protein